jgi:hypothetical protein
MQINLKIYKANHYVNKFNMMNQLEICDVEMKSWSLLLFTRWLAWLRTARNGHYISASIPLRGSSCKCYGDWYDDMESSSRGFGNGSVAFRSTAPTTKEEPGY